MSTSPGQRNRLEVIPAREEIVYVMSIKPLPVSIAVTDHICAQDFDFLFLVLAHNLPPLMYVAYVKSTLDGSEVSVSIRIRIIANAVRSRSNYPKERASKSSPYHIRGYFYSDCRIYPTHNP